MLRRAPLISLQVEEQVYFVLETTARSEQVQTLGERTRTLFVRLLGALWLLDGLLQLQPSMFTAAFTTNVVGNALMGLPEPLYKFSLQLLVSVMVPKLTLWNSFFAGLQIFLGLALLSRWPKLWKTALVLSIPWSLFLWVFGEGMGGILSGTMDGGVFPGTPSLINGFPGAAILYAWAAVLALMSTEKWRLTSRFSLLLDTPAIIFTAGAIVQSAPLMWTTYGQASIFAADLDNLPSRLAQTVIPISKAAAAHPVTLNFLELLSLIALSALLWMPKRRVAYATFSFVWLCFAWWFGLGLGGTLTGLGTDPNTPPVIALLTIPYIAAALQSKRSSRPTPTAKSSDE
ncbi:MAG: hypothetical protein QXI37_02215 [Thermoprotei archaeon]